MNITRIIKHLFIPEMVVSQKFPPAAMRSIEEAIAKSEKAHTGEIRFAVEGTLHISELFKDKSARERALDVFSQLRIWDTEYNNGVLIYLLLADRDIEIVADRGIHGKVGTEGWEAICHAMEQLFREGKFEEGVLYGINAITQILIKEYPATGNDNPNELPDKPIIIK